ncbi:hypothetical protein H4696_003422 [Amycolatopsis lexingtonensis]|uniref:Uncharacterized protein n=1 Tax=Amycolatopsis lexingtonensis TaxID=218822 RepID=A0ABR9HZF1_9PSEU|nr:hypothetical protein [Amycolatopsis lexingtonensis]MBE1496322.1 hypothetical protein [Amycolatopsis lexingtonensis]
MTPPGTSPFAFLWDDPALEPFTTLLRRGWDFNPKFDTNGLLERFTASFTWDTDGFVDALRIKSETDAAAIRMDHADRKVWECNGDALTVLHQLLELPEPSDPHAPLLVTDSAPRPPTP